MGEGRQVWDPGLYWRVLHSINKAISTTCTPDQSKNLPTVRKYLFHVLDKQGRY